MLKINAVLPRPPSDDEVEKSSLFSVSDESSVNNTQSINIDGGVFAQ
tara:strand:- start:139 stop:279 length:141 start_codon:yes stop_codon:yes gene_type:complete